MPSFFSIFLSGPTRSADTRIITGAIKLATTRSSIHRDLRKLPPDQLDRISTAVLSHPANRKRSGIIRGGVSRNTSVRAYCDTVRRPTRARKVVISATTRACRTFSQHEAQHFFSRLLFRVEIRKTPFLTRFIFDCSSGQRNVIIFNCFNFRPLASFPVFPETRFATSPARVRDAGAIVRFWGRSDTTCGRRRNRHRPRRRDVSDAVRDSCPTDLWCPRPPPVSRQTATTTYR